MMKPFFFTFLLWINSYSFIKGSTAFNNNNKILKQRVAKMASSSEWTQNDTDQAKEAREKFGIWPLDEYNVKLLNEVHPRDYVSKKELRRENEAASVSRAQNLMRKEKEWMSRMPKARTTKSKSRIDSFFELKKEATASRSAEEVELQINPTRLGSKILELHNV